jgi:hypothetical protein
MEIANSITANITPLSTRQFCQWMLIAPIDPWYQ